MSTDTKDLVQRLRTLSRDLIDVNSRRQAVEWCANTDGAMLTAADTIERLTTELANERARDIHSCHADCTRAGCVNRRLRAELSEAHEALTISNENSEFQRKKADAATATVYQFHYAMKDAGWHPGRTDDNLCDIIRAKGAELAALRERLEAAERLS